VSNLLEGRVGYVESFDAMADYMKRWVRNSLIVFIMAVALCFAVLAASVVTTRHRAKALLEDIHQLDAAPNATVVFDSLRQKYGNQLRLLGCASDECGYDISLTNGLLSRLHLVPRAEILAQFSVRRGSLRSVVINYASSTIGVNSPLVYIGEGFCANETEGPCDGFYVTPHGFDQSLAWKGDVAFGQRVLEKQRQAALALNLDCLTAFAGCRDISELLPTIWKRTRPGRVSSRWRSMADSIEDASHPLPN